MKIEKNQIDELNAELTLIIEKDDYLADYKKELKSAAKKAQMKGFRKGKTPESVVKKMYGNSLFQESVSKVLTNKINEIITGDEFNIIGEPFLIDRDNLPVLDFKNPSDYTYKFELGLEPEFNVLGISETDVYTKYKVQVSEQMIDDEVKTLLKRLGEQKSVTGPVQDDDVVYFIGSELYNGKVLVDGHKTEFSCGADKINEQYLTELKSLSVGDHIHADEEEARAKIRGFLEDYFDKECDNLVDREIMETLMSVNSLVLPETFLKKWMSQSKEGEMTDEQFESFKKELSWRIIKKKLVKRFEVEVKEEEIFHHFTNAIRSYSPYIDEESLKNTAFSLMNNREQVNTAVETISSKKLFSKVRELVQTEENSIEKDAFTEIVKALNQKAK